MHYCRENTVDAFKGRNLNILLRYNTPSMSQRTEESKTKGLNLVNILSEKTLDRRKAPSKKL